MGDLKEWSPNGAAALTPSSFLCNLSLIRADCWEQAEGVTKAIISCVRPTKVSDCRRKEVIEFVQSLIRSSLGCEVFPFGSVPLQTYLPDGDIDLTSFGVLNVEDALAESVFAVLQDMEHSMKSKYVVKDVQLIRAEVKLVKCLVQNIVVDISFNQLGGLCTLCFLEKVDRLIGNNHLFKRSIILIKAWCYYESRILGAHHGLISTYALETLVLYIFHVFHSSLTGPLAVLYKFLDYFSKFDWDNYCVSLSGPICISSFPEVTVEAPESCEALLLSNDFLRECLNNFSVSSGTPEVISRNFQMKHLNIVDPLKNNNNLGRSVSKGNFFRIRSAFLYGARKLGHILSGKTEGLSGEVQKFFASTLDRHGRRLRPDVQDTAILLRTLEGELTTSVLEPTELNVVSEKGRLVSIELSDTGDLVAESGEVNDSPVSSQELVPSYGKIPAAAQLYSPVARNANKNMSDEGQILRRSNSNSPKLLHNPGKDYRNKAHTTQVEQGNGGRMPEEDLAAPSTASSEPDTCPLPCRESTSNHSNDAVAPTDSLADLGGDYESNLKNLQQGRWFYKRAFSASFQPMQPVIPSQMAFRPNIFPPVSPGSNGIHHSPFYLLNQQMLNGAGYHIEEKPRMRGIGTYFPNVNQYVDSQPMVQARNFVILRSPRNNEHNVFTPDMDFLEGVSHEFSLSNPFMPPAEMMHASDSLQHESPRLVFPDANGSANSHQDGTVEAGSFDQLPLDSSVRDSPRQEPDPSVVSNSDQLSGTEKPPQHLASVIQERIASKSFRLKDVDDFPPLSS